MTVAAALVQLLHRTNRQKTDLKGQLARGPKLVAAAKAKLKAAEDRAAAARAQLMKMKVDADSKQLQMKEREEKIVKLHGKLNAAKENREYQALKDQIAADKQANLVLSDEILELLESLDEMVETQKASVVTVSEVRVELEKIEKVVDDKRGVLEGELARVEAELVEAEKQLSGDFKREYTRLVAVKGDDAMAELEGNCCSGCYQSLTPQMLDKLLMGQPVLCPACGRLIYQDLDLRGR
jgi:hypothetical protein